MTMTAEPDTAEAVTEEQLELFEGRRVTEMRLNFSGNTLVDSEVAAELELDGEVELVVKGRVVSATFRGTKEGTTVIGSRAVFIESVELSE
jgi:hypothetical protein